MSIISSGSLVAIAVSEGLAGPEAALSVLVVKAVEVQPSSSLSLLHTRIYRLKVSRSRVRWDMFSDEKLFVLGQE